MPSVLSPLQVTSANTLLLNQGVGANTQFTAAVTSYNSTTLIAPLLSTITTGSTGNILDSTNLTAIKTLGSTNCPALGDSIPTAYAGILPTSNSAPGFINAVKAFGLTETGDGDVSRYAQNLFAAQAYASITNQFIDSAVNSQTYLGGTFTDTNEQMTGSVSTTTTDIPAFAADLAKLGYLIDLANLQDWGSPVAVFRQIVKIAGGIPSVAPILVANGVSVEIVANLADPDASFTDTVQKQLYNAMLNITGDNLAQVLTVLEVTTPNITTMADLLDVTKILPNSYQTLTVPIAQGTANVFLPGTSSVNMNLATELPNWILSSTT